MGMIPAEKSDPARRWRGSGAALEGPFWAVVVVVLFVAGLFLLVNGALDISRLYVSEDEESGADVFAPLAIFVLGAIVVIGLLIAFGRHPRTRSALASTTFAAFKTIMFMGGIVLFLGGALRIIDTGEFAEQATLALLSLFFLGASLYLHFGRT